MAPTISHSRSNNPPLVGTTAVLADHFYFFRFSFFSFFLFFSFSLSHLFFVLSLERDFFHNHTRRDRIGPPGMLKRTSSLTNKRRKRFQRKSLRPPAMACVNYCTTITLWFSKGPGCQRCPWIWGLCWGMLRFSARVPSLNTMSLLWAP